MTQQEIKDMARNMVGDGGTPNMWFVTVGPYVILKDDYDDSSYEIIDGYDKDKDAHTYGPFNSYKEALECYDDHSLDVDSGVGQVFIEDRQCGVVKEKWLTKKMVVEYEEDEVDDSKIFYRNN